MATQEIINIGTLPNDGEGDPLRVAFGKINNNFANLFPTAVNTSSSYSTGDAPGQLIFETAANTFTMGQLFVYAADAEGNSSQSMQLNAQINQALDDAKFSAVGTSVFGSALTTYSMQVSGGNVQLLADPLVDATIFHFIGSQLLWIGANVPGLLMGIDGYIDSVMSTENDLNVSTEQAF
jgi:hypothetical protein